MFLVIAPGAALVHLKISQYGWEYTTPIRTISNAAPMCNAILGAIYLWNILFDFKFQEVLYHSKTHALFEYNTPKQNEESVQSDRDSVVTLENDLGFKSSFSSYDIVPSVAISDQIKADISYSNSFWVKQRNTLGNPFVVLLISIPLYAIYVISFYIADIINTHIATAIHAFALIIVVSSHVIIGTKISIHRDSFFLRGI